MKRLTKHSEQFCFERLDKGHVTFVRWWQSWDIWCSPFTRVLTLLYYPTALRRVQIRPKMSTNITSICTPEDRWGRFSFNVQAMNWIQVPKTNLFSTFCFARNLKVKNLNRCLIWTTERRFCTVIKSELNFASDSLVKTTKIKLTCSPAVEQSVSGISRTNSVPLHVLLSCILCK